MTEKIYDVIIIGSGPAGMSAGLYASRANLDTLIIERGLPGGQMLNTDTIENYIGAESVNAQELSNKMHEDSLAFGANYAYGNISEVKRVDDLIHVSTAKKTYLTKTAIVATGTIHKKLEVDGEIENEGRGISYCATCDGPFFQDKRIAVVGGGDSALESANYLTQYGDVVLIHRRNEYRGEPHLQDLVRKNPKITELLNNEVVRVNDKDNSVSSIELYNNQISDNATLDVDGVFINVGQLPQTQFLDDELLTDIGWVKVDKEYHTPEKGIFAIGDVIEKDVRQVANAVGEGSEVIHYVFNYIQTL